MPGISTSGAFGAWLVIAGMLFAAPPFVHADPVEGERPENAGKLLYRRYCASCHGPKGQGDGPLASLLVIHPPDLTGIAQRNGGRFPFWEVMRVIDGTTTLRAHGDADMPVWGEVFRDEAKWDLARRAEVQGKLTFLTDYLRSVQAK